MKKLQHKEDSPEYLERKKFFDSLITLYGRNVAVEVLEDENCEVFKVHLSTSNRDEDVIVKIKTLCEQRGIDIKYHDNKSLSRISKNSAQDQGVAIDVVTKNYKSVDEYLKTEPKTYKLLALESIQNPQNLGMIIRSAAAGNIDAIILPKKTSVKLSPLVMKASAGTMFKIDILYCSELEDELHKFNDSEIYALSLDTTNELRELKTSDRSIFILGNESEGISHELETLATSKVKITMRRGVESLNVAVTASLIAFM
ncbi:MAG: 23S rRNA (guanosine(2251)-2'-O)-methyltransferase RlmB [Helicobacteraceae bacterium]|nr:23S rRNA (guanosine(2251)-2'-O)-methyltransferase RlmB [Helicobacteraceae bacterium]